MARIHTMMDTASVVIPASATVYGSTVTPRNIGNAMGIMQTDVISGSGNVYLQGRLATGAPWTRLTSAITADAITFDVGLVPQVRIEINNPNDLDVTIYLLEQ